MPNFWQLAITPILKIHKFPLGILILKAKIFVPDFVSPAWKLSNPYYHSITYNMVLRRFLYIIRPPLAFGVHSVINCIPTKGHIMPPTWFENVSPGLIIHNNLSVKNYFFTLFFFINFRFKVKIPVWISLKTFSKRAKMSGVLTRFPTQFQQLIFPHVKSVN